MKAAASRSARALRSRSNCDSALDMFEALYVMCVELDLVLVDLFTVLILLCNHHRFDVPFIFITANQQQIATASKGKCLSSFESIYHQQCQQENINKNIMHSRVHTSTVRDQLC